MKTRFTKQRARSALIVAAGIGCLALFIGAAPAMAHQGHEVDGKVAGDPTQQLVLKKQDVTISGTGELQAKTSTGVEVPTMTDGKMLSAVTQPAIVPLAPDRERRAFDLVTKKTDTIDGGISAGFTHDIAARGRDVQPFGVPQEVAQSGKSPAGTAGQIAAFGQTPTSDRMLLRHEDPLIPAPAMTIGAIINGEPRCHLRI